MQRVQAASVKLESAGYLPEASDAVVDVGSSAKWSHVMRGCSPCLTASRAKTGGHYLLTLRRLMMETEICRLQGIPDGRFDYAKANVAQNQFLQAVGNAMSSNVVARILGRALPAANLSLQSLARPDADALVKFLGGPGRQTRIARFCSDARSACHRRGAGPRGGACCGARKNWRLRSHVGHDVLQACRM